MSAIIAILLYIAYAVYFSASGYKDAVLWSKTGTDAFSWNEHIIFGTERAAILAIGIISCIAPIDFIFASLWIWSAFPFFHNGFYYLGRNKINNKVYPNGFWSEPSKSSSAKINFSKIVRIALFIFSFLVIIPYLFSNANSQELTKKERRELARKVRKGEVSFTKDIDTVFLTKEVIKTVEVPKEVIKYKTNTIYKDTCELSRVEMRHKRKKLRLEYSQKNKELENALKIAKQERIKEERLAKTNKSKLKDSLNKIIKLQEIEEDKLKDSLKVAKSISKNELKQTRIENRGWTLFQKIITGLLFIAGIVIGRFLNKFI